MLQGDQCTSGLNFLTLRPRDEILADYRAVLSSVYQPEAYFERVQEVGRRLRRPTHSVRLERKLLMSGARAFWRLCWQMTIIQPHLRSLYWRTVLETARHNPSALEFVLILLAFYLHLGRFSQYVIQELDRQIAELRVAAAEPVLVDAGADREEGTVQVKG